MVVGFMRGHWVHSGSPWGSLSSSGVALRVVRFICGRWVHSRSPWVSLCSSRVVRFTQGYPGFVWFTRVRPCGRSVHPVWFSQVRPWGRCVHPESLDSLRFALGVVGFIRVRWVH